MSFTLVYKTYAQDLPWIRYSLLSVKKFLTGYSELLIYCHDVCCGDLYALTRELDISCRIIPVSYNFHGYLKQMVVKSECYKDVSSEYIVIIDSDVIFNSALDVHDLILQDGRIEWFYHEWPIPKETTVWKKAYESMTKTEQNVHYMSNGFPFVFTRKSMADAAQKFTELHGIDYAGFCQRGCGKYSIRVEDSVRTRFLNLANIFEEFEWLGFYCHNYSSDYVFTPQTQRKVHLPKLQFWSHGGITPEIEKEIRAILNLT